MTTLRQAHTNAHCNRPQRLTIMDIIRRALLLSRQRKTLSQLNDATLLDIGITREQARCEARRPLWDAPNSWRK